MLIFNWWERKAKDTTFLSINLAHSCVIIHYIVEENVLSLCLQAFSTQGILKTHIIGCFKINGKKKKMKCLKKANMLHSKITRGKRNSCFMIYTDFESILITEYYDDLYLIYDVFLLTDIFEKFRNSRFKKLCPSHYLRAPALSWDAMFNVFI